MKTTDAIQKRLQEICARYGVARLEVFGSVARGEATEASDIDLLYTLVDGAHLGWEIEDLAIELAHVLGRPVDLVSRTALHDGIRAHALRDVRPLYAAA